MKKIALPLTVLVTLLIASSLAFAIPGSRGAGNCNKGQRGQAMTYEQHQEKMDNRLERMGIILDLSSQQKDQMRTLFDQQWKEHQLARTEIQTNRDAMHSAKTSTPFNEKEFRKLAQKHANLKADMMVDRVKMHQQVIAILTPEQQKKAEQLHGMEMGHHGKHGGMGRGMNGGSGPGSNDY